MPNIFIRGLAGHSNIEDRSLLDGVHCQECFSEYFSEEDEYQGIIMENEQPLIDKGVRGGYMRFEFSNDQLDVVVQYTSNQYLTSDELEILKIYTQGQLSDGIGEGFEQFPCTFIDDEEVFISPWYGGQILTAIQI